MIERWVSMGRWALAVGLIMVADTGCGGGDDAKDDADDTGSAVLDEQRVEGSAGTGSEDDGEASSGDGEASSDDGEASSDDGEASSDDGSSASHDGRPLSRERVMACDDGPIATVAIEPPVPQGCLDDVSAGDHTFVCGDVSFMLKVPERCTEYACGLIVDVHGGTMSAEQMRKVTELDELAPPCDYIVLHPSETSPLVPGFMETSQWHADDDPKIRSFIDETLEAFQVDRERVHFTGFSLGGGMSWRFICGHGELFTSVAPIAATTDCAAGGLDPEFPILYMHGHSDAVEDYAAGEALVEAVADGMGMGTERVELEGDNLYTRYRYENDRGTTLDFIEHDYGGQPALDGHCVPGGVDLDGPFATTCQTPPGTAHVHWGELVLDWFLETEGR